MRNVAVPANPSGLEECLALYRVVRSYVRLAGAMLPLPMRLGYTLAAGL